VCSAWSQILRSTTRSERAGNSLLQQQPPLGFKEMSNDDRGTLAIAALIIACVSLVLSLLIGGFLLLKTNGERTADSALPPYLSEKRLASIAESIVEPFNAGDFDALYNVFDPAARAQISADTLRKQLDSLRPSIGKIEAASYMGWQKIPSPGTLPMYQLQYSLKLSGGNYASGSLSVKVMDHGDHEGVIFFFVAGTTPQ
jgi:hypothetical protein